MELFKAHNQWKSRPIDERFQSLSDMHNTCLAYRENAVIADVPYSQLRVAADGDDLRIVGASGASAKVSHWAMSQLSGRAGAPASYLRELPATLAAQNLNYGLKEKGINDESSASLLFHNDGSLVLRAATSEKYTRIWNSDITERLVNLQNDNPNWINPMAYEIAENPSGKGWPV